MPCRAMYCNVQFFIVKCLEFRSQSPVTFYNGFLVPTWCGWAIEGMACIRIGDLDLEFRASATLIKTFLSSGAQAGLWLLHARQADDGHEIHEQHGTQYSEYLTTFHAQTLMGPTFLHRWRTTFSSSRDEGCKDQHAVGQNLSMQLCNICPHLQTWGYIIEYQ